MAADDHQLVGILGAADGAENIPDVLVWMCCSIGGDDDASLHRPGPDVITERQPALPSARQRTSAPHVAQQLGGVLVRRRNHRDARKIGLIQRNALGARNARVIRRRWIAVVVVHATTLDAGPRTHRTFGIDVALSESVICRIAVDDERERAMLLGFARLDTAI